MKAPTLAELRAAEASGHVNCQVHPELPLLIWNYSKTCGYEGAWDDITLQCRGLITDLDGQIVARPFIKFFNIGEEMCPVTDPVREPGFLEITEKMDGSLGIVYPWGDGTYAVATRGSFTSEQALHATEILRTRYRRWAPPAGVTVLLEIIYPDNRIVLDYDGLDDLVYLAAINNVTGGDVDAANIWPGPARQTHLVSLNELLHEIKNPIHDINREGYVLVWPGRVPALRAKLKYESYVALHRVLTGLSTRVIYEALMTDTYDDLFVIIPDEYRSAVNIVADDLVSAWLGVRQEAARLRSWVLPMGSRREQAQWLIANKPEMASFVFSLLDGKSIDQAAWRSVEPKWAVIRATSNA